MWHISIEMTVSQSFQIYEILDKYFKNPDDAKSVVTEIEQIIDTKLNEKKDALVTKEDLMRLQIDIEKRFNQLLIWLVATFIAFSGIVIAVIKL